MAGCNGNSWWSCSLFLLLQHDGMTLNISYEMSHYRQMVFVCPVTWDSAEQGLGVLWVERMQNQQGDLPSFHPPSPPLAMQGCGLLQTELIFGRRSEAFTWLLSLLMPTQRTTEQQTRCHAFTTSLISDKFVVFVDHSTQEGKSEGFWHCCLWRYAGYKTDQDGLDQLIFGNTLPVRQQATIIKMQRYSC